MANGWELVVDAVLAVQREPMFKSGLKILPFIHWKPERWLADSAVMLMTLAAKGAHCHLMMLAWSQDPPCSLPDDQELLAAWCGLVEHPEAWPAIWNQVQRGWKLRDGRWWQVGLCRAYLDAAGQLRQKSEAGRMSVKARRSRGTMPDGPERRQYKILETKENSNGDQKSTNTVQAPFEESQANHKDNRKVFLALIESTTTARAREATRDAVDEPEEPPPKPDPGLEAVDRAFGEIAGSSKHLGILGRAAVSEALGRGAEVAVVAAAIRRVWFARHRDGRKCTRFADIAEEFNRAMEDGN